MKGAVFVFIAVLAVSVVVKADDDIVMHNDPELDRIVREAIDLGESSVIERALSPATSGIYMPLEDASELKASLLSISDDILGTPKKQATAAAPKKVLLPAAAPLETAKPSLIETSSLTRLLENGESVLAAEKRFLAQKQAELLKDKAEDSKLLGKFSEFDQDVKQFENFLEDKKVEDPVQSFLALETEATEVETATASSLAESSSEAEAETEVEAETESKAETETETETETEAEADAEEAYFLEVEASVLASQESTLAAALARAESPAAEVEALEPTLSEELEAVEAGADVPNLSFLLTNEELTAKLDHLASSVKKSA